MIKIENEEIWSKIADLKDKQDKMMNLYYNISDTIISVECRYRNSYLLMGNTNEEYNGRILFILI